ncbi:3-dehydroquinate synthase [Croceitalea sp. MTPC9]|uniref:3-dehydroquinate synthase n=1 Tax=unclassified Croceitalea TaxID=2632280 RepID=UPI002B395345|nr:3-dehydroquinate synthase [Croceitalea sp. MTPC6]GMN15804.1 3-dehydroquinate synthase [Croceitalea sp. MTPC9]
METVSTSTYDVHFTEVAKATIRQFLGNSKYSKVFVLVDTNTKKLCLNVLKDIVDFPFDEIIEIKPGEENKTIDTCLKVWQELSDLGADRKSLLLNLGGGVVTDLGGFVASTYKRGINFINIPTTLLAMVDASIGGKTGVDLGSLKNQVGVINQPKMVLIFPEFLNSLGERQTTSGFAEMLKHGLISDSAYWTELTGTNDFGATEYIQKSVYIKNKVVQIDPTEQGIRKKLNFGHTMGHSIESYFLDNPNLDTLLHGEAIAVGMILEGYFSHELCGLSKVDLNEIKNVFLNHFKKVDFSNQDIEIITDLLKHDKKNSHGDINFVLLSKIGSTVLDVKVPQSLFKKAFAYYKE